MAGLITGNEVIRGVVVEELVAREVMVEVAGDLQRVSCLLFRICSIIDVPERV